MMEIAVGLLAMVLAAVAVALMIARQRAGKRLEESARKLMESHREFGNSMERLAEILRYQNRDDDSRPSVIMRNRTLHSAHARRVYETRRAAALCGRGFRHPSMARRAPGWMSHNANRFSANDAWESYWSAEDSMDEYAPPPSSWR